MIGRVIEEEGQKIVQTLAGATAGTVCKVNYGTNCNYAIPITPSEVGEGYVGISCVCPGPYYNPATGTLTVCNICGSSSGADNADKVKSNSLSGDTVYNIAMWCATSDGCYNGIGFSGGRSITYNPYTATLNACCGNFANSLSADTVSIGSTLRVDNGITVSNANADIGEITSNGVLYWNCGTCFTDACITNLTVTNKINGSICRADGTSCYNLYCLDYMSGSADRPILMTSVPDTNVCSQVVGGIGRSTNCSFTYNPNTGVLKRCGAEMGGYTLSLPSANGGTMYALIDVSTANGNLVEGKIYSNTFSLAKFCGGDAIYRHSIDDYGTIAVGHINDTTTCVWVRYGAWTPMELFGQKPIKLVCSTTTAPSGITFVNSTSSVSSATFATCACLHFRCGYSSAFDFDIALENGTSNNCNLSFVSTACRLRYCNTTGALRITNASGCPAGEVSAYKLCAGEGGIDTNYDVNGHCDDSEHTDTWYIYCDGSACFNGDVSICGNFYAGVAVIGTNNINIGCYSTVCGGACSSAIGFCAKSCVPGFAAIGNCAEAGVINNVAYAAQIDMDSPRYGRHGRVKVAIPSWNVICWTWNGLAYIIANIINKGRCTCTWTTSSICNVPVGKSSFYGVCWNDTAADGYTKYGPGINATSACNGVLQINCTASSSNVTICQLLYSCHCTICLGSTGLGYGSESLIQNGYTFDIIF